uniref:SAM domain-containing protein n=1 Tax=Glossina pallidipes TaxID=7398 RepID=A0A1B0A0M8_GLOPL
MEEKGKRRMRKSMLAAVFVSDLPVSHQRARIRASALYGLFETMTARVLHPQLHFRDQCIDGSGLPLLTEDHLVNSLGMKLGPALKLRSALAKKLGGPCPNEEK